MHNNDEKFIQKSLLSFKYSKYNLGKLIIRMKKEEKIDPGYIKGLVDFYRDKKTVDVIPIKFKEIKDVLLNADIFIDYCKKKNIDWEFISREKYENLFPKKKGTIKKRNKIINVNLEYASDMVLKSEHIRLRNETTKTIDEIDKLIAKLENKIKNASTK